MQFLISLYICVFILGGCTYSINMVHTSGQASDVVDETQSNQPDVSPNINIPLTP